MAIPEAAERGDHSLYDPPNPEPGLKNPTEGIVVRRAAGLGTSLPAQADGDPLRLMYYVRKSRREGESMRKVLGIGCHTNQEQS